MAYQLDIIFVKPKLLFNLFSQTLPTDLQSSLNFLVLQSAILVNKLQSNARYTTCFELLICCQFLHSVHSQGFNHSRNFICINICWSVPIPVNEKRYQNLSLRLGYLLKTIIMGQREYIHWNLCQQWLAVCLGNCFCWGIWWIYCKLSYHRWLLPLNFCRVIHVVDKGHRLKIKGKPELTNAS